MNGPGTQPLIAVVGATASGKTALSLALAQRFGAEIINVDSRQVYAGMPIGTAQPSPAEQRDVPHHLVGCVAPDAPFGLAQYLELARRAVESVEARGRLPVAVGGSGQYVRALSEGWEIPRVAPDAALRARLEKEAAESGAALLHQRLARVDPEAAGHIDPNNVRRVIRALEVFQHTGRSIAARERSGGRWLLLGIAVERSDLLARIDRRVEAMFAGGLIEEVEALRAAGYSRSLPSMQSIGYPEVWALIEGEIDREEAIRRSQLATHRLARMQHAWFGRDPRIHWLEPDGTQQLDAALGLIAGAC